MSQLMNQLVFDVVETASEQQPAQSTTTAGHSLMTPLGVVEGEILSYLDEHPVVTLKQLSQKLGQPAHIVLMGVGALIRTGLVRGLECELDILLKSRRPLLSLAL